VALWSPPLKYPLRDAPLTIDTLHGKPLFLSLRLLSNRFLGIFVSSLEVPAFLLLVGGWLGATFSNRTCGVPSSSPLDLSRSCCMRSISLIPISFTIGFFSNLLFLLFLAPYFSLPCSHPPPCYVHLVHVRGAIVFSRLIHSFRTVLTTLKKAHCRIVPSPLLALWKRLLSLFPIRPLPVHHPPPFDAFSRKGTPAPSCYR